MSNDFDARDGERPIAGVAVLARALPGGRRAGRRPRWATENPAERSPSGAEVGGGVAATGRLVWRMMTVIFEALMLGTGCTASPCTSPVV